MATGMSAVRAEVDCLTPAAIGIASDCVAVKDLVRRSIQAQRSSESA